MVPSKALWHNVRVLEHLEWTLAAQGKRAVTFMVSTASPSGRRAEDVFRWEAEYGWPLGHHGDNGDLEREENHFFYRVLEPFPHWGRDAVKVCLVNQFGWERDRCGWRMPEAMRFTDLRTGTDLEFGQSIYEPFGMGQVDPLQLRHAVRGVQRVRMRAILWARTALGPANQTPTSIVADYV